MFVEPAQNSSVNTTCCGFSGRLCQDCVLICCWTSRPLCEVARQPLETGIVPVQETVSVSIFSSNTLQERIECFAKILLICCIWKTFSPLPIPSFIYLVHSSCTFASFFSFFTFFLLYYPLHLRTQLSVRKLFFLTSLLFTAPWVNSQHQAH